MKNGSIPIKKVLIFWLLTVLLRVFMRLHWFSMKHCSRNPARELGLQEVEKSQTLNDARFGEIKVTKQSKTDTSNLLQTPHKAWAEALKFIDERRCCCIGAWDVSSMYTTGKHMNSHDTGSQRNTFRTICWQGGLLQIADQTSVRDVTSSLLKPIKRIFQCTAW